MAEESNHYGHTAARPQGRPGREARPASITVDMHSHVLVPAAAALVQMRVAGGRILDVGAGASPLGV